jgi:hypothetical protein
MLKAIRLALVLALLAAPVVTHAGAVVTHEVSRDDGGYINMGPLGGFGSQVRSTSGQGYSFWLRAVDANNIIPFILNWFAYTGMGPQYSLFMMNGTWTGDHAGLENSLVTFGPTDNLSWAFHKVSGVDWNDGNYHHHVLTWTGFASNKPTGLSWYIDGVLDAGAWTDFSDGAQSDVVDFAQDVYMGCSQKTASNTLTDFASFRVEDFRIYTRGLSADEVRQIYKMKGRDMIRRGLFARYPFWSSWINIGPHGVAPIPANDNGVTPTLEAVKLLSGTRRKVMRIDMQRLLSRPANEDKHLAEPPRRMAA